MTRVSCPHCGFLNFSISAVCGRCEGSLREGAAPPQPVQTPRTNPSAHHAAHTAIPPPPPAQEGSPTIRGGDLEGSRTISEAADDDFDLAPVGPPRLPARAGPAARRVTAEISPLTAVPPPKPPAMRRSAAAPAVSLPIDVNDPESVNLPAAPRVTGRYEMAGMAQIPPVWRQLSANLVDLALLGSLGAAVSAAVGWVVSNPWPWESVGWFDALASWMAADPLPVWAGVAVVVIAGPLYGLLSEQLGLRTAGRFLAGLTLTRKNGLPLSPWRLRARAALSLVSALPLGAGYLFAIVSPRGATLHDHLCGTAILRPMRRATRASRRVPRPPQQQQLGAGA